LVIGPTYRDDDRLITPSNRSARAWLSYYVAGGPGKLPFVQTIVARKLKNAF